MSNNAAIGNPLLLHVCCGVCLGHPVHKLRDEGYCVTGYFFNPNIYPKEEYMRRLDAAREMADALKMELLEGDFLHDEWLKAVSGLESEKEGGKRCEICFEFRLNAAHRKSLEIGSYKFTSTLSVSPHKNFKVVSAVGKKIAGRMFLSLDFKKDDGFKKTRHMARQYSLYCQNYCGCEFSMR